MDNECLDTLEKLWIVTAIFIDRGNWTFQRKPTKTCVTYLTNMVI